MVSDGEVVYIDGDFAILKSEGIFSGAGFNVYKSTEPGGSTFEKVNQRYSWFKTFDAAKSFMKSVR